MDPLPFVPYYLAPGDFVINLKTAKGAPPNAPASASGPN